MLIRSFRKYLAGRSRFVRPPSQSLSTDMQCILLLPTIILSIECFTFPSGSTSTKILVPAYGYPTGESPEECVHQDYLRLAGAGAKVAAIVNPSNGPSVRRPPAPSIHSPTPTTRSVSRLSSLLEMKY